MKFWRKWTKHKKVLVVLLVATAASNTLATVTNFWIYVFIAASLIVIDFTLLGLWTWTGQIYNEEEKKKIPRLANKER